MIPCGASVPLVPFARSIPVLWLISGTGIPVINRRTGINHGSFRIAERLDRLRLSQRLMRPVEHTGTVSSEESTGHSSAAAARTHRAADLDRGPGRGGHPAQPLPPLVNTRHGDRSRRGGQPLPPRPQPDGVPDPVTGG